MPRWPAGLHLQGSSGPARGAVPRAVPRPPLGAYGRLVKGVPLQPGQVQGSVPSSGELTLSIGPSGLGTVWFPVQLTLSTSTGVLDTAVANAYLGSQALATTLAAPLYSGNGVIALAIPPMTPGQLIIVRWTGATSGDVAAVNVIGTMEALATSL